MYIFALQFREGHHLAGGCYNGQVINTFPPLPHCHHPPHHHQHHHVHQVHHHVHHHQVCWWDTRTGGKPEAEVSLHNSHIEPVYKVDFDDDDGGDDDDGVWW